MNTEGMTLAKVLENKELADLVTALGCGMGKNFDLARLRYGKVIILADADSDGHHIATLLLTFLYRHLPQLISNGKVYLAQPPLYRIDIGKETFWALDDAHRDRLLKQYTNGRGIAGDHAVQGSRRDDAEGAVGDDAQPADAAAAARRDRRSDRDRSRHQRADGQGRVGALPLHHGPRRRRAGTRSLNSSDSLIAVSRLFLRLRPRNIAKGGVIMRQRQLGLAGYTVTLAILAASSASGQTPPTCEQLGTDPAYGLEGNPVIIQHSTTLVPASGSNPAYCRVDFVVSERGGPESGYAADEIQRIGLRVGLPANSSDGGTDGDPVAGEGAWNGRVRNLGGGGLVGAVGNVTAATNARYVGSSTDSGHTGNDPSFGVIQATHELNLGKIEDFFSESLRLQYQWALRLAERYYVKPASRNYWDGCSTGGRQGLVLASKYGGDFDGFLIGAPHSNHTRNSSGGSFRQWANKDIAGGSVTDAKFSATIDTLVAACDGLDGVEDGL